MMMKAAEATSNLGVIVTDQERLEIMLEYVAGTLDAPQTESVRQALFRGDPAWAAALAEAEATLASFAAAIAPLGAPPAAKSALMKRVAQGQTTGRGGIASPDEFRSVRRFAQAFAAVAAIILIAVLANVWMNKRIDTIQVALAKEVHDRDAQIFMLKTIMGNMEKHSTDQETRLVALQKDLDRDSRVLAALHSSNLKLVTLGSDKTKAVGHILIDDEKATWHLFASALAPLPADKTYELWFITPDQKKIPGGTFNVDAGGNATFIVTLPKDIGPVALAAVTDEVAGGVQVPAGSIQLVGKVQ